MSNKLLDSRDKYQAVMKQLLNKTVTIQQDGWSSVQNDPVIATVSDGKGYFVDAKDTGTHKTAEACKAMFEGSKSHAETTYGCKIRSFITHDTKNMDKIRRELEEEEENLIPYCCLSHVLNLLGQDLTPAPIMKHIVEISKFFRNYHVPSAWLKGQPGSMCPQLPSETRRKGQLICLDSYLTNRTYYIKFIQDHPDEGDRTIVQKIMDMNMFQQVRDLANMLRPVTTTLDLGQSDKITIADACNIFMNLLNELVLQDHRDKVQKRFDFVITPCHLVAYMFHPKYLGAGMTPEQIETVKEWLIYKDEAFLPAAIAFQEEATPFPASFFTTRGRASNPVIW